jgi:hypothetical protein
MRSPRVVVVVVVVVTAGLIVVASVRLPPRTCIVRIAC